MMRIPSEFINKWKLFPTFMLGVSVLSIPVAYIIKKHMDWKSTPDAKQRMFIHHLVFWGSGIPALKFLHKTWGELERGTIKLKNPGGSGSRALAYLSASVMTMILGFEGGERLSKYIVPKRPKSATRPNPMTSQPFNPYYQPKPFQDSQIRQRSLYLTNPTYRLFANHYR